MTILFSFYKFLLYCSFITANGVSTEFSGVVLDKNSNEPISNVYVYTIKGEEEALSSEKGVFKLLSWQATPVTVYFDKKGYKLKRIQLGKEQKNARILLEAY